MHIRHYCSDNIVHCEQFTLVSCSSVRTCTFIVVIYYYDVLYSHFVADVSHLVLCRQFCRNVIQAEITRFFDRGHSNM